jgi:hypothetical protein
MISVQNYTEMTINPPKSRAKGWRLSHVTSVSEILVHFGKENSMKLDGLTAFIKLGDELIPKGGGNVTIPRCPVSEMPGWPDARCLLDVRDAAASLGKYAWNALEIFRRLSPFGTSALYSAYTRSQPPVF